MRPAWRRPLAARDLVDQRLREVEVSFDRSREERAADAAAAAERLARLEAQHVEALANLQMLEGQLADANAALHLAEQCVATERLTAERQAARAPGGVRGRNRAGDCQPACRRAGSRHVAAEVLQKVSRHSAVPNSVMPRR